MGGQWLASVGKLLASWCLAAICVLIRFYQQQIDPIDSIHNIYIFKLMHYDIQTNYVHGNSL